MRAASACESASGVVAAGVILPLVVVELAIHKAVVAGPEGCCQVQHPLVRGRLIQLRLVLVELRGLTLVSQQAVQIHRLVF